MAAGHGPASATGIRRIDRGRRLLILDATQQFAAACPDWLLTLAPLREHAVMVRNAHHVVLIDSMLPADERDRQILDAIAAITHPDVEHPRVTIIDM